uniref:Uncharacterized protein n=1 Tax=Grammatophora oceanica TaxID=210454 RepID=A0A7S1VNS9_9STRA|mmetsp:Transcript_50388/g.75310  ORF Transcript_50388/g.75310 Transcript_50388/m.75310 type:complete len:201 (+) Transcript_50388:113-715(+)|eukprot:CAMPEP_0194031808 /NCGR_PEP_ID=MMETSP0009_2-20130614/4887_1 /TAXON_ID=210454 /ORGANISM="Grammatophora oceanica, Strain CCMP 410" /LENGTH=200 /DNA_ID=CAMNT_0038672049 /DNA_START=87 /DNA_END=689 /DNA_ORIENTATION=-
MFSIMLKLFDDQVPDLAMLKEKASYERNETKQKKGSPSSATEFKTLEFGCTSISDETALSDISLSSCESKPCFVFNDNKEYSGVASMVDQIESARSDDGGDDVDIKTGSDGGIDKYESVEARRRSYRKVTLVFDDVIPPNADTVDYLRATMAQDQDDDEDDDNEASASTSFSSSVGTSASEEEAAIESAAACYYFCYNDV